MEHGCEEWVGLGVEVRKKKGVCGGEAEEVSWSRRGGCKVGHIR